jgi:hypothetical protein
LIVERPGHARLRIASARGVGMIHEIADAVGSYVDVTADA